MWNHALFNMLRDGSVQISMAQVGEMLPHYFKEVDGRWYLRGEAVIGGNAFDLKTDMGAITWLTQVLSNESQTTGELIPRWQAETAHLGASDTGRLDRLLEQTYWQDQRTGRWRAHARPEREKMSNRQSLADEAHLRVVRRFLAGDLDRRPNDWELSEWLLFLLPPRGTTPKRSRCSNAHPAGSSGAGTVQGTQEDRRGLPHEVAVLTS